MVRLATLFNARCRVSVLACAIASAVLGVELSLTNQSASAIDVNLLNCPGTQSTSFSPGLSLTPQQTTFKAVGSVSPCVSVGDPTINAGTFEATGTGLFSCLLNSTAPYSITYKWNNGKSSTVRYEFFTNVRGVGQTVFTGSGTVLSGEYVGARAVQTLTLITPEATGCVTPQGATSNSGVVTLTFIGPLNLLQK
ncbi:MAG: hypothetical protein RMY35_035310 [Nostoc sp. DedSLP01]|nr:hypothetical protein [Nostoc sp. DedSLP05]MDZ8097154.1 hypothetical protein [Nostoc sp. DedSLP01]